MGKKRKSQNGKRDKKEVRPPNLLIRLTGITLYVIGCIITASSLQGILHGYAFFRLFCYFLFLGLLPAIMSIWFFTGSNKIKLFTSKLTRFYLFSAFIFPLLFIQVMGGLRDKKAAMHNSPNFLWYEEFSSPFIGYLFIGSYMLLLGILGKITFQTYTKEKTWHRDGVAAAILIFLVLIASISYLFDYKYIDKKGIHVSAVISKTTDISWSDVRSIEFDPNVPWMSKSKSLHINMRIQTKSGAVTYEFPLTEKALGSALNIVEISHKYSDIALQFNHFSQTEKQYAERENEKVQLQLKTLWAQQ